MLIGMGFRELLALGLQSPRPYWLEPGLRSFSDVATVRTTFGLPSGHALIGPSFWIYLAWEIRRRWAWVTAILVVFAIGVSRVYLGVHFLSDVVLGWFLGALLTVGFRSVEPSLARAWTRATKGQKILAALAGGLLMLGAGLAVRAMTIGPLPAEWAAYAGSVRRMGVYATLGGALSGFGIGVTMLGCWAGAGGAWWLRLLRIGIAGSIVLWVLRPVGSMATRALGVEVPEGIRLGAEYLVTALRAWCVAFLIPWAFLRFKLAVPEPFVLDQRGATGPSSSRLS
jgi:hypothetical protein